MREMRIHTDKPILTHTAQKVSFLLKRYDTIKTCR